MTAIADIPKGTVSGFLKRFVFSIPILGRMLHEVAYGDKDNIYYFLFTVFTLWLLAVLTWGYAAFIIPVLMAVPSMFVVLILITVGK
ncbi:hypothetical protein ASD8599_01665 [Ascidiaceihabitans donghaensis]|uniref:Uncharacterized protein n=1 Tax=Ascidiaceihabitans donghaensis TaxID=1510460 RepID=A0A2R8BD20_9RHOB|nr:hypothetical protein [Ascidiaceihabitans donghaensis]SPH20924.1 hypothetical protein ASD8599_01665 [Ascidiaceihabitans donghaensis]